MAAGVWVNVCFGIPVIIYNFSQGYNVMLFSNTCIIQSGGGGGRVYPYDPEPLTLE
jgi:hypothetical protein